MKCQNRHAPTGIQARWQMAQQHVERGKLVVHCDAQRLKHAAHREIEFILAQAWQRGADGGGKFADFALW